MIWNRYPYTDFHELNMDWIIGILKEMEKKLENFVATNSIKYANPFQWSIVNQYEKNTLVIDPNSGTAYLSVQAVPRGVAISNTDYWTPVFDLSQLFTGFNKNITANDEMLNIVSSTNYAAGDWLIWKNKLYEVIASITAGDLLVPGTNLNQITIESVIDGINSVINGINLKIDNTKIINVLDHGAVGDGVTDDSAAINACIALANTEKKSVYIPDGTYMIKSPLIINSSLNNGVKIFGNIKGFGSGTTLKTDVNSPIFDITSYCEISDIIIMGTKDSSMPNQIGIRINNCNSVNIHGCNFFSLYNCIEIVDTVFYSRIENCRFSSCVESMIKSYESTPGASPAGFNVVFKSCNVIANSGQYGFRLGNIGSLIMDDCEVSPQNLSVGLFLENEATSAGMSMISNSGFEQTDHAIMIGTPTTNVKNIFFSNVYAGSGSSAVLLENATGIYFNGGDITGGTVGGDGLVHVGTYAADIKFSHIMFNTSVACFTGENTTTNYEIYVDNCSYPGDIFLYIPNIPFAKIKRVVFDDCNVQDLPTMFQYPSGAYPIIRCKNAAGVITTTEKYTGTLDASGNANITVNTYGINNQVVNLVAYYQSGSFMPVALNTQVTGATKVDLSGGVANAKYVLFVTYCESTIWS